MTKSFPPVFSLYWRCKNKRTKLPAQSCRHQKARPSKQQKRFAQWWKEKASALVSFSTLAFRFQKVTKIPIPFERPRPTPYSGSEQVTYTANNFLNETLLHQLTTAAVVAEHLNHRLFIADLKWADFFIELAVTAVRLLTSCQLGLRRAPGSLKIARKRLKCGVWHSDVAVVGRKSGAW